MRTRLAVAHRNNWDTGCMQCFQNAIRPYELGSEDAASEILIRRLNLGLSLKLKRGTVLYRGIGGKKKVNGISWTASLPVAAC